MKLRISGDKLTIAAAHMLSKHDKCARLHGHNYQIEVEIDGELDHKNMVIDFGVFKSKIGELLKRFDHKILLPAESKDFEVKVEENQVSVISCEGRKYRFPREDVELLPLEATTVELLSKFIHDLIKREYSDFKITITMSETPTSVVVYSEQEN